MAQTESKKVWIIYSDYGYGEKTIRGVADSMEGKLAIVEEYLKEDNANIIIREVELNTLVVL